MSKLFKGLLFGLLVLALLIFLQMKKVEKPAVEPENAAAATEPIAPVVEKKKSLAQTTGVSEDVKKIIDSGVLRVGMCAIDQPPFHVKNSEGKFEGFDLDFARDVAATLDVKVEIVEGANWDTVVEMMIDGKVDIMISNLSMTPERATRILYSKPYAKIRQCLLVNRVLLARANSEGLMTLRQIFDHYSENSLLIQEGTSCIAWASALFPKAKVTTTVSWDEILQKILDKKVFGTISDEIEIRKRMKEVQTMELQPIVLKGRYDIMVVGVPKTSPQLLHFINAFIDSNSVQCDVENFDQ